MQDREDRDRDDRIDLEDSYWHSLLTHTPLALLTDLDGVLLPFAATPELARPTPELLALIDSLATSPGLSLAIVSGRPRDVLDSYFPNRRGLVLFAEHGGWKRGPQGWEPAIAADEHAIDSLFAELEAIAKSVPGVKLERKTWSVAVHFRVVPSHQRASLLIEVSAAVEGWLDSHSDFEILWGSKVLEVRPRAARKSIAVESMRHASGPEARLLIVGDDTTDEDMFAAAGEADAAVLVNAEPGQVSHARWRLDSTEEVHSLYREIVDVRKGALSRLAKRRLRAAEVSRAQSVGSYRLLVVSNRLPELRSADAGGGEGDRKKNVGGLVSALRPVLEAHDGVWLGWSGRTRSGKDVGEVGQSVAQGLSLAAVDFPEAWHRQYYNGLANGALWPLLHSFPGRVRFAHADWKSYVEANQAFADIARRLVGADATIWVHDYHLMLMGGRLRTAGHKGPIGFFQHVPFPGPDLFFILPWANEILEAMLGFDVIGFHTPSYVENFLRCMATSGLPNLRIEGHTVIAGARPETGNVERRVRVEAFPLGIVPEDFQDPDPPASDEISGLLEVLGDRPMVLGVDRLDYTKGIPERIDAFGRLLALYPEWRKKTSLVQVSVPSRADVRDYQEQRTRVEKSVGRINGEFGTADWVPIRYLYRSYGRPELAQLYRAAAVGYVTPLRDGMNLVAKEYVAAQDEKSPGVLLLSRFAGAAEELRDALMTNPWDPEGAAHDLDRALRMPLEERVRRHGALSKLVAKTTALTWAEDFLRALEPNAANANPSSRR